MTPNPLLAIALALLGALLATIAAAVYAAHRTRRRIAELSRQTRRELSDALRGQPPPATGTTIRLAPRDVIVIRVRRGRPPNQNWRNN